MNIFVSYRRSDSQDLAGRLVDRLRAVRQIDHVFLDVDGIEPGAEFPAKIRAALTDCDVCIVVIGPNWRGHDAVTGTARIFDDADFVRLEAATALGAGLKVLPLLTNGASMPKADELPSDLQRLPTINALPITHMHFDRDIEHLTDTLLSRRKPGSILSYLRRHPMQAALLRAGAGIACALGVLLIAATVHRAVTGRSLAESMGGDGPVWMLIFAMVIAGAMAALFMKFPRRSEGRA